MLKLIAGRLRRANDAIEAKLRTANDFAGRENYRAAADYAESAGRRALDICNDLRNLVRCLERRGYNLHTTTLAGFAGSYLRTAKGAQTFRNGLIARHRGVPAESEQS